MIFSEYDLTMNKTKTQVMTVNHISRNIKEIESFEVFEKIANDKLQKIDA